MFDGMFDECSTERSTACSMKYLIERSMKCSMEWLIECSMDFFRLCRMCPLGSMHSRSLPAARSSRWQSSRSRLHLCVCASMHACLRVCAGRGNKEASSTDAADTQCEGPSISKPATFVCARICKCTCTHAFTTHPRAVCTLHAHTRTQRRTHTSVSAHARTRTRTHVRTPTAGQPDAACDCSTRAAAARCAQQARARRKRLPVHAYL